MIVSKKLIFALLIALSTATVWAQSSLKTPHIGYLYPSGGQTGDRFQVLAGGQNLRGLSKVLVTGDGVKASVIRYMGRPIRLNRAERRELIKRMRIVQERLMSVSTGDVDGPSSKITEIPGSNRRNKTRKTEAAPVEEVKLPRHPLLDDLDNLGMVELEFIKNEFLTSNDKKQPNLQIAETALIEIAISSNAIPGDRELRIKTALGMTNPMCFQVGLLPEICEHAPYDEGAQVISPVSLPILLNGQIKPGDVDRFSFRAKGGQKLVIKTHARHLIPFLADAVPGWFQATLALYDNSGDELAFADDYRFSPDPVLFYVIPETGLYELEIRDSIYRGRDDFIYRLTIGEQPFITSMFPLGGREEDETVSMISGWNLEKDHLPLDTRPDGNCIRQTALHKGGGLSNQVTYAVDALPECNEDEPNDSLERAQRIRLPQIINGRINKAGDKDFYRFRGGAGNKVIAEVLGRRLSSPIDSLLRLIDDSGNVIAWNDDYEHKDGFLHRDMDLITHHADSYLCTKLPHSGFYYIQLTDSQNHGGDAYGYRLRISPPQPDFTLRITPSTINMRPGITIPIHVHALRKDGFDGPIEVTLKGSHGGFILQGEGVPAGRDSVRMTLTSPYKSAKKLFTLEFECSTKINKRKVIRRAIPSEDVMQAFLYRHLVPSKEFLVALEGSKFSLPAPPQVVSDLPIKIRPGRKSKVRIELPKYSKADGINLELSEAPAGLSIKNIETRTNSVLFELYADKKISPTGYSDNLIIMVFKEGVTASKSKTKSKRKKKSKKPLKTWRYSLGVLPAIPIKIVKR